MQADSRISACLTAGGLVLLVCLAYASSTRVPFAFDDMLTVQKDILVQRGEIIPITRWTIPSQDLLRASYALTRRMDGTPLTFHLINVGIHSVNVLLVYWILGQLGMLGLSRFLASGVFALHPLQTESVTYVSGRSEILAACFVLCGLACYLSSSRWKWIGVVLSVLIGLTVKLSVGMLFILIPGIAVLESGISRRPLVYLSGSLFFGFAVSTIYVTWNWRIFMKVLQWTANQCAVFWRYVFQFFIPRQSLDWALTPKPLEDWRILLSIVAVALLLIAMRRGGLFGIGLLFALSVIPRSALPMVDLMVEHRLYLPMIGFAILSGRLLQALPHVARRSAVIGATSILLCLTIARNDVWASELSLWKDATVKAPTNPIAHINLAREYHLIRNYEAADDEYQTAITHAVHRIMDDPHNYKNLDLLALAQADRGMMLVDADKVAEGEQSLQASLTLVPHFGPSVLWLSRLWNRTGRLAESISMIDAAFVANTFGGGFRQQAELYATKAEALCELGFQDQSNLNFKQAALLDTGIPLYICTVTRK